jgi:mono/diheme cytochrome c family protein
MKKLSLLLTLLVVTTFAALKLYPENAHAQMAKPKPASKNNNFGGYETQVQWGEHLVTIGACGDCHTPKKMTDRGPVEDSSLLLSGHPAQMPPPDVNRQEVQAKGLGVTQTLTAWVGPWGVSFTANLTPDETGIGNWTEQQFIYSLRNGKFKGIPNSRPILPPMPWQSIGRMTDDELKAIFSYLKSIKPINNQVPNAMPPVGS